MKPDKKAAEYIRRLVDRYKYILVTALVGLLLLLWPSESPPATPEEPEELMLKVDVSDLEQRLETVLGKIHGVGRVEVALTIRSGYETVYLYNDDRTYSETGDSIAETRKSTLVQQGSGSASQPIVSKVLYPVFQGALVVCQGADSAAVQLQVTEAVRALTGLASHNIVISKMSS